MHRRKCLSLLGSGMVSSVAGCVASSPSGEESPNGTEQEGNSTTGPASPPPPRKDGPRTITGPTAAGMESFDRLLPQFMDEWDVPGASVAVVKDEELVFARGYGQANTTTGRLVQPTDRFRIASLSKPITAVSILKLYQEGRLDLSTRAFDVLSALLPADGPVDPRIRDITVKDLLYHAGGWDIDEIGFDPMFSPVRIAQEQGKTSPADSRTIIRFMLDRELNFSPGSKMVYSNFGYCVLGRVIEEVTGQSYDSYVANNVLKNAGITDMKIGATRKVNLADDEVRYYGHETTESVFKAGKQVPAPYGSFYLQSMDSHGGWIASAVDLMRFITHVDGRKSVADILPTSTIDLMTQNPLPGETSNEDIFYALGWSVRPEQGNWWHKGSLPGTSSILVRTGYEDLSWAALLNTRPQNHSEANFNLKLDRLLWDAIENVSEWPDRNLFSLYQ